jgi:hypothetical protein
MNEPRFLQNSVNHEDLKVYISNAREFLQNAESEDVRLSLFGDNWIKVPSNFLMQTNLWGPQNILFLRLRTLHELLQ